MSRAVKRVHKRRPLLGLGLGLAGLLLAAVLALVVLPARVGVLPEAALHPPASTVVLDRHGEPLRSYLAADQAWRMPVSLDAVSPLFVDCLLASEDRRFGEHHGVDPRAVGRALLSNLRAGRVVSGASTVTMQLARMADPQPRTFSAKLVESWRALGLEASHSKAELLTGYVNMLPFGSNIAGVEAASRLYFAKPASELGLAEAALLAVIPRAPAAYDPLRHPEAARTARNRLLDRLAELGVAEIDSASRSKAAGLPTRLHGLNFLAPHACDMVRAASRGAAPITLSTTLDAGLQRRVESVLARWAGVLAHEDLENAAAVLVHVPTGEVRALAGSLDYLDASRHGFVNAAAAPRSPGSTLKPLLYGLAFEQGECWPDSYLDDIPADYAGYSPANYDGEYLGRLTAAQALAGSRNAPAVALLQQVGLERFHSMLRRAGLASLDADPGHYGLALALGACEVSLLELTNLYAALARGGAWLPWRLTPASSAVTPVRLVSPGAAQMVGEILTRVQPPEFARHWNLAGDAVRLAWKTGTSFGHRDAWAVGFTGEWALGVWTGNLDGSTRTGISGARHAGPLLFELVRAVAAPGSVPPEHFDHDRTVVRVCALSHQLPGPGCSETVEMAVLAGRKPLQRCAMHRLTFVDAATGLRLEGPCLAGRDARQVLLTQWSPQLTAWRSDHGLDTPDLPVLDPACRQVVAGPAPVITAPSPATPYLLRAGVPAEFQRIALAARAAPGVGELSWYQDGRLAAQGAPGTPAFVTPQPGRHRLVVVDDAGRSDGLVYEVLAAGTPAGTTSGTLGPAAAPAPAPQAAADGQQEQAGQPQPDAIVGEGQGQLVGDIQGSGGPHGPPEGGGGLARGMGVEPGPGQPSPSKADEGGQQAEADAERAHDGYPRTRPQVSQVSKGQAAPLYPAEPARATPDPVPPVVSP